MSRCSRRLVPPLLALILGVTAACGDGPGSAEDPDALTIVASTSVYGDVAAAIVGDLATVRSIISSDTQDPHEYEATAQDRLALDGADLIIENGGGYDGFIDTLLEGAEVDAPVLNAVEISGLSPEEEGHEDEDEEEGHDEDEHGHVHLEGFNEHVWYDVHVMEQVAVAIHEELSDIDPDNAATYEANLETFVEEIEALEAGIEQLHDAAEGLQALSTEPVPAYLLAEAGLVDVTPADFTQAVEEGADVPPRALQETLDLVAVGDLSVLAYNSQTEDATTQQVRAAAEDEGLPVVEFTETLPEGTSYLAWMQDNLDRLAEALDAS